MTYILALENAHREFLQESILSSLEFPKMEENPLKS